MYFYIYYIFSLLEKYISGEYAIMITGSGVCLISGERGFKENMKAEAGRGGKCYRGGAMATGHHLMQIAGREAYVLRESWYPIQLPTRRPPK